MSEPDRAEAKGPPQGKGTLRELFLKTGRPLEEEVAKILPSLPASDFGSYSFRRSDEGRPESVDRRAMMKIDIGSQRHLNTHFFIECKYSPNAKWVFYDAPSSIVHDAHNITSGLGELRELVGKVPFLNAPNIHGGDVFFEKPGGKWESVPDVITDGLRQSTLAALDAYASTLANNAAFGESEDLDVFIPVLVTSAQMRRICPKTRLADIENDEAAFEKALLPTPYANYFTSPPMHLQEAFHTFLQRHLDAAIGLGEHVDDELSKHGGSTDQVVQNLWQRHIYGIPSRALVIHIDEAENGLRGAFNSFTTHLARHGHEGHWT